MKKLLLLAFPFIFNNGFSQLLVDTLAMQNFDSIPFTSNWIFTGPVVYNSGCSMVAAAPPSSPIGIGGSRAWETTVNSTGLVLEFANIVIPPIYDSVRVHFNLAAMNLTGSSGGPDDLDYVLTEVSLDSGVTYYGRLRIRGALANNSFWPYSATGVAKVYYQPTTEALFQPTNSGLQTTEGYSNCEIVFPGSVSQVRIRMTGRSSSSSDTWLVDNLVITGEYPSSGICNEMLLWRGAKAVPNPFEEQLEIQSPFFSECSGTSYFTENTSIKMFDMMGREVFPAISRLTNSFLLTTANLSKGIYFIKTYNEQGIIGTQKVIKQ